MTLVNENVWNRCIVLLFVVFAVVGCNDFSHNVNGRPSDSPASYYWNLYRPQSPSSASDPAPISGHVPLKIVVIDPNNWPVANVGISMTYAGGESSPATDNYGTAYPLDYVDRSTVSLTMVSNIFGKERQILTSVAAPPGIWLFRADFNPLDIDGISFRWPEGVFAKLDRLGPRPCKDTLINVPDVALATTTLDFGDRSGLPGVKEPLCRSDQQTNKKFSVIASARRNAAPYDIISHNIALDFNGGKAVDLSLHPTEALLQWQVSAEQAAQSVKVFGVRKGRWYEVFSWAKADPALIGQGGVISDFPAEKYWSVAQTYRYNSADADDKTKLEAVQAQSLDEAKLTIDFPRFGLMQPTLREDAPRSLVLRLIGDEKPDVFILHMKRGVVEVDGNIVSSDTIEWTVYLPPESTNIELPLVYRQDSSSVLYKVFFPTEAYVEAIDTTNADGYDDYMNRLHANGFVDVNGRVFKRETVEVKLVPTGG